MKNRTYVRFTKEMKKDYTVFIPNMLPIHFDLIARVLNNYGIRARVLKTAGPHIAETGLKYVHNDTCYPAVLVIGQFIDAIENGGSDPRRVALLLFQTGGGCRASNYISLLRKALSRAGYEYVPVISFSLAGIESHPGFRLTLPMLHKMLYAVTYGDLLMSLVNQTKPYEKNRGDAEAKADEWAKRLAGEMAGGLVRYSHVKKNYREMVRDFQLIPKEKRETVKVGIVGEIFVKYSPLGNNDLESFLVSEGAEVVIPGLLDFCMYCVTNGITDHEFYGRLPFRWRLNRIAYRFLLKKQKDVIKIVKENGAFTPYTPFDETFSLSEGYISHGVKMGEGWLLTAEMIELSRSGAKSIVCTQPFGCLPNHICGKGMMKPIKEKNPAINIIAIDYDTSASVVNQQNRIKLMLAAAKRDMNKSPEEKESVNID